MGNVYTNFIALDSNTDEVLADLKALRRRAIVLPGSFRSSVVFDARCDEQDVDEIEALGASLSKTVSRTVIACMNHDDDHLLLWIFQGGNKAAYYEGWTSAPDFAWKLSRIRGGVLAYPLIAAILGWPVFLFQIFRHKALLTLLSFPGCAAGFGYEYLSRGELPNGYTQNDIRQSP